MIRACATRIAESVEKSGSPALRAKFEHSSADGK